MKASVLKINLLLLTCNLAVQAVSQEIISLPAKPAPENLIYTHPEQEYFSPLWNTQVVTNVSEPSLTFFKPDPSLANGTAVIICPGGGLYALSINSEGYEVAKWLTERGVTAFVLKYRLVPTGEDGVKDLTADGMKGPKEIVNKAARVLPVSVSDGLAAIQYVRTYAEEFGVDPNKIGLMGFSAGGAVTMGTTYQCDSSTRPNFIAPIYAWMDIVSASEVPAGAPPLFVVCATDDPLGLADSNAALYTDWLKAGKSAEAHFYAKGGHGFGMRQQNLPSDRWIDRFGEWMKVQDLIPE